MVSKARLDLPEPESPVTTMSLSRGSSSDTFFRLWTRAPCTAMVVRGAALGLAAAGLPGIGTFCRRNATVEKRHFLHPHVALLRQSNRQRRFTDQLLIGQVLTNTGDAAGSEVAPEVVVDFARGTSLADFAQVVEDGLEQVLRAGLRYRRP